MDKLPDCLASTLQPFENFFSAPVFLRFSFLILARILSKGPSTISSLIRLLGACSTSGSTSWHHFFLKRKFCLWELAFCLAKLIMKTFYKNDERVSLSVDDTVFERPGKSVYGKDKHRDAVRSSHSYIAHLWGHKWVVIAIVVKLPIAQRQWSLPILVSLYRTKEWNTTRNLRHRTPGRIARIMLYNLTKNFHERRFIVNGDSGFGTHEMALFAYKRPNLELVNKLPWDAMLFDLPKPQNQKRMGRPRIVGDKQLTPKEIVDLGLGLSKIQLTGMGVESETSVYSKVGDIGIG